MIGVLTAYELVTIGAIAAIHVFTVAYHRAFPKASRWLLDFSSGLGLGYAFLYLMPKIGYMTATMEDRFPQAHQLFNNRLYFYMLVGFLMYYLVDFKGKSSMPTRWGLVINIASFSIYNLLVGITIAHLNHPSMATYFVAAAVFSLHLFGVNSFVYKMYPSAFEKWIKWLFVLALAVGLWLGTQIEKGDHFQSVATALVGGIIVILSVRLKLPAREWVDTGAFVCGIAAAATAVTVYTLAGLL